MTPDNPLIENGKMELLTFESTLTKREQFAMAAMQGLCANPNYLQFDGPDFARLARIAADSLAAELKANPAP
jgi:hypothetical protein